MGDITINIPEKFRDHALFKERICGSNFGFMAKRGYYLQPEVIRQPELMREMGINWVTVNMNFCQTHYYSQKVYLDFEFSTGELELYEITKRLHDNGIKVLFKPCLTSLDGAWMGWVGFPDELRQIEGVENNYWDKWFRSFLEAEKYFADLAQRAGMDAMIIGAEYFGTEGQDARWRKVIEEVRKLYTGPITYEFTCNSRKKYGLKWFDELDFLSYSYYPPACPVNEDYFTGKADINDNPDYTVEQLMQYLESRKARIRSISERFDHKPILFTEYGVRSSHGCIMRPFEIETKGHYDGQEQANFMEASFRTFHELPEWMGLLWWKWDETQYRPHYHADPAGNRGFTVQGKPAEEVMRKWAAIMKNEPLLKGV
ncbi:MAG: hypothetical protein IKA63_02940 [Clostridia bacterium]|nr:hypothetical protein [Clostridia bacterium]